MTEEQREQASRVARFARAYGAGEISVGRLVGQYPVGRDLDMSDLEGLVLSWGIRKGELAVVTAGVRTGRSMVQPGAIARQATRK